MSSHNLLHNSGFEIGTRDWCYTAHPSPPVENILFSVDPTTSWEGDYSLKIGSNGALIKVSHRQLYLKGDRYTFSCYLKADNPGQKVALEVGNRMGGDNKIESSKEVTLTDSWQRFYVSIDVPESEVIWKKTFFCPCVKMLPPIVAQTLWLDGAMIQQGEMTDYQPCPEITAGIRTSKETNVFDKGEEVEIVLCIFNPFTEEKPVQVSYEIKNFYGNTVEGGELKVLLKAQRVTEREINPSIKGLGYFVANLHINSPDAPVEKQIRGTTFAIIDPVDIHKVPKSSPFGAHCPNFGRYWELGEKVGIKWLRGGLYFHTLASPINDGEYNEIFVETARRRGHAVLSVSVGFPGLMECNPISGIEHNQAWKKYKKEYAEGWKRLAGKYKDRVDAYEIWNEPQCNADLIAKVHETAYNAIKSVDQKALVVANLDHIQSLRRFLQVGGYRFCDVISIHNYRYPYWRGPVESNLKGEIHLIQEIIKAYASHPMPIWITELGWAGLGDDEKDDLELYKGGIPEWIIRNYHTERELANYVVQSYILALSGGVDRYFYHSFACSDFMSPLPYDLLRPDRSPRAALVAFAVMAKNLSSARFVDEILANEDCLAYLFESDTHAILCYWRGRVNKEKEKIELSNFSDGLYIIDLMGNKEETDEIRDGLLVPLDDTPRYAVVDKSERYKLVDTFRSVKFERQKYSDQVFPLEEKVKEANVKPVSFKAKTTEKFEPVSGLPMVILSERDGTEMVLVPEGEFIMGQGWDEGGCADEEPKHKVYLSAYYIDKYEVTNAQFDRFVSATGYQPQGNWRLDFYTGRENHPVSRVSWDDAIAYCQWVGKHLPTEAEWEKASRGTDGRIYPWGNTWDWKGWNGVVGMHKEVNNDRGDTTPVGNFPSGVSPYGCYDMSGNLWEWCSDWYGEDYYKKSPYKDPQGPSNGTEHVSRGGDWYFFYDSLRCAARFGIRLDDRVTLVGFRCALSGSEFIRSGNA